MTIISQQQLITEGDFLNFTLKGLGQSFTPFSFEIDVLLSTKASSEKINAQVIAPGMIVFTPEMTSRSSYKAELPQVVLSSGIHGNETAPIEMCQAWIQKIILGEQALGVRVLFMFGNLQAICAQKRFISHNLNTLFSSQRVFNATLPTQTLGAEKNRAAEIEYWVNWFFSEQQSATAVSCQNPPIFNSSYKRFHLDLHTAIRGSKYQKFAISPYLNGAMPSEEQRQFLINSGLECLLMAHAATKAFTYFTSSVHQAVSFTLELGKVNPWGENNLSRYADFIQSVSLLLAGHADFLKAEENVLDKARQSSSSDLLKHVNNDLPIFVMHREILRSATDFRFHFADDIDNFTVFPKGYVLANSGNEMIKVETSEEAILFPNAAVEIGQRALLTVVPVE